MSEPLTWKNIGSLGADNVNSFLAASKQVSDGFGGIGDAITNFGEGVSKRATADATAKLMGASTPEEAASMFNTYNNEQGSLLDKAVLAQSYKDQVAYDDKRKLDAASIDLKYAGLDSKNAQIANQKQQLMNSQYQLQTDMQNAPFERYSKIAGLQNEHLRTQVLIQQVQNTMRTQGLDYQQALAKTKTDMFNAETARVKATTAQNEQNFINNIINPQGTLPDTPENAQQTTERYNAGFNAVNTNNAYADAPVLPEGVVNPFDAAVQKVAPTTQNTPQINANVLNMRDELTSKGQGLRVKAVEDNAFDTAVKLVTGLKNEDGSSQLFNGENRSTEDRFNNKELFKKVLTDQGITDQGAITSLTDRFLINRGSDKNNVSTLENAVGTDVTLKEQQDTAWAKKANTSIETSAVNGNLTVEQVTDTLKGAAANKVPLDKLPNLTDANGYAANVVSDAIAKSDLGGIATSLLFTNVAETTLTNTKGEITGKRPTTEADLKQLEIDNHNFGKQLNDRINKLMPGLKPATREKVAEAISDRLGISGIKQRIREGHERIALTNKFYRNENTKTGYKGMSSTDMMRAASDSYTGDGGVGVKVAADSIMSGKLSAQVDKLWANTAAELPQFDLGSDRHREIFNTVFLRHFEYDHEGKYENDAWNVKKGGNNGWLQSDTELTDLGTIPETQSHVLSGFMSAPENAKPAFINDLVKTLEANDRALETYLKAGNKQSVKAK